MTAVLMAKLFSGGVVWYLGGVYPLGCVLASVTAGEKILEIPFLHCEEDQCALVPSGKLGKQSTEIDTRIYRYSCTLNTFRKHQPLILRRPGTLNSYG